MGFLGGNKWALAEQPQVSLPEEGLQVYFHMCAHATS